MSTFALSDGKSRQKGKYLSQLERLAFKNDVPGLQVKHIEELIGAICSCTLKDSKVKKNSSLCPLYNCTILGLTPTQASRFILSLVPREKLNPVTIRTFALWAITNCRRLNTKSCLLPAMRWINCVLQYDVCQAEELLPLYEGFFHLLGLKTVSCIVADILFKLTGNKKSLVTKWRIAKLSRARLWDPNNQQLTNLLLRMLDLRPDLSIVKVTPKRRNQTNVANGQMERAFQSVWSEKTEEASGEGLDVAFQNWQLDIQESSLPKKSRKCLLPPWVKRDCGQGDKKLMLVGDCRTLRDLVQNMDRIYEPYQVMALLGSPQMFYLLFLTENSTEMMERLSITLYYTLHNEFFSMSRSKGESKRKLDLLCRINLLQDFVQQGLPVVGRFLTQYLMTWDGEEYFVEVCKLLAYLQLNDFTGNDI